MWPFSSNQRTHARLRALEQAVDDLGADLGALKGHHLKLRGRVYALWGKEKPAGDDVDGASPTAAGSPSAPPAPRMSREELRRLAGLTPGRPYPHRDTQPTEE